MDAKATHLLNIKLARGVSRFKKNHKDYGAASEFFFGMGKLLFAKIDPELDPTVLTVQFVIAPMIHDLVVSNTRDPGYFLAKTIYKAAKAGGFKSDT